MTRIECSRCGETVEFTGTSVTLPFICNECAATPQTPDNPVGLKNVKKVNNPDGLVNAFEMLKNDWASHGDTGFVEPAETSTLPHDEATIENTTLLIADLEEQVRAGKRVNDLSHALLVDMKEQLQVGSELLVERDATISKLNDEIQYLTDDYAKRKDVLFWEYQARTGFLLRYLNKMKSDMTSEIRALRFKIFRLSEENHTRIRYSQEDSTTIANLRIKNKFLETRGFFGRMFNVEP